MGVVGALSVPIWKSFSMSSQSTQIQSSTRSESDIRKSETRQPASIQKASLLSRGTANDVKPSEHQVTEVENKSMVLTLDCRESQEIVVDARYLRLKSARFTCLQDSLRDLTLKNQANGFTGSVIFHQNGLTTDYIDLNEGLNSIKFTAKTAQGEEFSKTIKILRRSLASVPIE